MILWEIFLSKCNSKIRGDISLPPIEERSTMELGYNLKWLYKYQAKEWIKMDLKSHPHLLLTGSSGSGKSYALKQLIYHLLVEKSKIFFCNFKKSEDFKMLEGHKHYFTYLNCADGLEQFYALFKSIQERGESENNGMHILIFDEYPAFILSESMVDKKKAEIHKQMISEILMLGRSYGFGIWLVMQRPDSDFFSHGARDNFQSRISLGNLKKESKAMLYSGEELPETNYKVGEGICYIDGKDLKEIMFPRIDKSNLRKLDSIIRTNL